MSRRSARPILPDLGPDPLRPARRRVRPWLQLALIGLWTLVGCLFQALLLRLPDWVPGRAKVRFARVFWAAIRTLLGLRVRVIGQPARIGGRPVVFVANHCSWLDIVTLGSSLHACFVSKDEVSRWPIIKTVARMGRTVFVSRTRSGTGRERNAMQDWLARGDNLILFPEGTSTDGVRVLPFRSAFFSVAEGADPPLIQPVSIAYDRLGFLPVLRGNRALFGWYGDMDLEPHVWAILGRKGLRATIKLHEPLDPAAFANRKTLSHAAWIAVADGAAQLRQDRA